MPKMTPQRIRRTRRALLAFYDAHRRSLPWRERPDPYGVWISEVMLQQTRVDAVLPYYRAWMKRFPDARALADAPLGDVLRAWEGLGYYSRARNLHRAALMLRDRMGGELPGTASALRGLPGIGEYTAGAVASIAFGEAVPAVDGNVRRVLARVLDEPEPTPGWLREQAGALVDPDRPGDLNQALMELGATVCTPRSPACGSCPLRTGCAARLAGTVAERPRRRPRGPVPDVEYGVAVLLRTSAGGARELLLVRRPDEGLLGGLWELPTEPAQGADPARAAARAARAAGAHPRGGALPLPERVQIYSHFRGIYRPFLWIDAGPVAPKAGADEVAGNVVWANSDTLERLALPAAYRAITLAVQTGRTASATTTR